MAGRTTVQGNSALVAAVKRRGSQIEVHARYENRQLAMCAVPDSAYGLTNQLLKLAHIFGRAVILPFVLAKNLAGSRKSSPKALRAFEAPYSLWMLLRDPARPLMAVYLPIVW